MKLIDIIRFIRGYVGISIKGGFTERFINLCSLRGIHIWNLQPETDEIHGFITARKFKMLRSVAKKSGVKITILNKKGLPFIIKKYKSRAFLFIGVIFFIVFIMTMNRFVWFIEVTGTDKVSTEEILTVLDGYGLKTGVFADSLDEAAISRNAVNYFDRRLMWMAINIKGSKAIVEVRDFIDEHTDTTFREPCNIIADFEGKILSIEAYNGDSEVKAGNAVKVGDLLISGVIQNRDMSADYLEARGKITALHTVSFSRSYNTYNEDVFFINTSKQIKSIKVLGLEIPLFRKNTSAEYFSGFEEYITYNNLRLPFGKRESLFYETKNQNNNTDFFLTALDSYVSEFYYNFKNTTILTSVFETKTNNNTVNFSSNIECIDYIGQKSMIYVDNEKNY